MIQFKELNLVQTHLHDVGEEVHVSARGRRQHADGQRAVDILEVLLDRLLTARQNLSAFSHTHFVAKLA